MAITKRGHRRITVDEREYVWWISPDEEDAGRPTLSVASSDKRFFVRYPLQQPDDGLRALIIVGAEFPGLKREGGCWSRVQTPRWESDNGTITPAAVRRLVAWCFCDDRETAIVD